MSNNILENNEHNFPVEKRPLFYLKKDHKYGNDKYAEVITGRTKTMGVIRTDTEDVLGVCSSRYQIITHDEVKVYTDDLIKSLDYEVSSRMMDLPDKGAAMLYFNILNNNMTNIHDINLKIVIMGKNSYNGKENASIECVFINEDNTIYGYGLSRETKLSNKKLVSHKGKVDVKKEEEFGALVQFVPDVIVNTIKMWNIWDKQNVRRDRVMLICRALGAGFAKYMKENNMFTDITRFEFYSMFCKYNMNLSTFGMHYKSYKATIGKLNMLFTMDEMFQTDSSFAVKVVERMKKFDSYDAEDNPDVKKIISSRTYTALKKGVVVNNYQLEDPIVEHIIAPIAESIVEPVVNESEQIVEHPEVTDIKEKEEVTAVNVPEIVTSEDDDSVDDDLLKGW